MGRGRTGSAGARGLAAWGWGRRGRYGQGSRSGPRSALARRRQPLQCGPAIAHTMTESPSLPPDTPEPPATLTPLQQAQAAQAAGRLAEAAAWYEQALACPLYTAPSPRD